MRGCRSLILLGTLEAALHVALLGQQAHGLAGVGVGEAVVGHGVQQPHGPVLVPGARARQQVRSVGHGLLAAGDHHRGLPQTHQAGGVDDRGKSREADLVDGHGGDVPADARGDRGLARRVLTGAGLDDLAHEHRVHGLGPYPGTLQRPADRGGPELDGAQRSLSPEQPGERRASASDDDGVGGGGCGGHGEVSFCCDSSHHCGARVRQLKPYRLKSTEQP